MDTKVDGGTFTGLDDLILHLFGHFRYHFLDTRGVDTAVLHELVEHHVSGQLRVAPEHISDSVLRIMGKPSRAVYDRFVDEFERVCREVGKEQYIVPYLMSSHPGSTLKEAVELAEYCRDLGFNPEQVQDFYPTPATVSTCIYYTGVDPRNIHAFVLGEHGDSESAAWSRASIAGMTLDEYCADCGRCKGPLSDILDSDIEQQVRRAAYSIIELKGATYYAIAVAVRRIVEAILRDEQSILTVSTLLEGQYGLGGVCLSVPAVVGRKGVERVLEAGLSQDEKARLIASARAVKAAMGESL